MKNIIQKLEESGWTNIQDTVFSTEVSIKSNAMMIVNGQKIDIPPKVVTEYIIYEGEGCVDSEPIYGFTLGINGDTFWVYDWSDLQNYISAVFENYKDKNN